MLYAETYSAETELLPIPRCTNVSIEFKWACVKSDCNKFNIFFCVWCVVVALQLCNRFRCVFHILLALYISNQYAKRTLFSSLTLFRLPFSFFSYTCFHSMFIFFSSYFRNGHPIFQCYTLNTWENRKKKHLWNGQPNESSRHTTFVFRFNGTTNRYVQFDGGENTPQRIWALDCTANKTFYVRTSTFNSAWVLQCLSLQFTQNTKAIICLQPKMGTAWTTAIVSHHRKGEEEWERGREDLPWKSWLEI